MNKTEQFIERAKQIHGDKYDYSKVEYKNANTKVCIICPIHGEFWQIPYSHLKGHGCIECSGVKKCTTEEFIRKAKEVHGDKYDYSKVVYINNETKVCIICPKHGEFWQTPDKHINRKHGCPKCGGSLKLTIGYFIEKANKVHRNKYDYSKIDYVNNETKICIICPVHGEFYQTPKDHLNGNGCPKCGIEKIREAKISSTETFIDKYNKININNYDTSKVVYVNSKTKVCMICPKHGEFWATPNNLLNGRGCPKCKSEKKIKSQKKYSNEEFINELKKIHGDKYSYDKTIYNGLFKKCVITCKIHGDFEALPVNLLKGHGCKKCAIEKQSKERILSWEEVFNKFKEVHRDKYTYDETTYKQSNIKMKMFCEKHGEFWQTPEAHISGHGCPICKESKLERTIRHFLNDNNIQFESQKRIGRQFIDFFIPKYNIAIECQGEQHFKPKFFQNEDSFKNDLNRDLKKYNNMLNNGYKVIYFTEDKFIKDNIFIDGIYNGIYKNDNVLCNLSELLEKIK